MRRARTLINANGVYRPFTWLSVAADANYDRGDYSRITYTARGTPLVTSSGGLSPSTGRLDISNNITDGYILTGTATATKAFGDLTMRLSQRGETRREYDPSLTTTGTDFATEGLKQMGQARTKASTQSIADYRVIGGITSLGLSYGEKYIGDFLWRLGQLAIWPREPLEHVRPRVGGVGHERGELVPVHGFQHVQVALQLRRHRREPELLVSVRGDDLRRQRRHSSLEPRQRRHHADVHSRRRGRARFRIQVTHLGVVDLCEEREPRRVREHSSAGGFRLRSRRHESGKTGGNVIEATLQGTILQNVKGLQWTVLAVADRANLNTGRFGRTCFADGLQNKCDGIRLSEMWGNQIIRDKAHLAARHANSLALFDVNDEGFVVPVGAGNTWRDGIAKNLWGTSVLIDGVSYGWGLPLPRYDENGQLWYGKIGDSNPAMKYG